MGKIAKNTILSASAVAINTIKKAVVSVMDLRIMSTGLEIEAETQILSPKNRMKP
jgi:hypothetical protein